MKQNFILGHPCPLQAMQRTKVKLQYARPKGLVTEQVSLLRIYGNLLITSEIALFETPTMNSSIRGRIYEPKPDLEKQSHKLHTFHDYFSLVVDGI